MICRRAGLLYRVLRLLKVLREYVQHDSDHNMSRRHDFSYHCGPQRRHRAGAKGEGKT